MSDIISDGKSTARQTIYAINIKESREETLRVLQLLFAYGYVFDSTHRIRTVEKFLHRYDLTNRTKFTDWFWIILNKDDECKRVITGWSCMPSYAVEIKVEDYLKLHAAAAANPSLPQTNQPTLDQAREQILYETSYDGPLSPDPIPTNSTNL